MAIGSQVTIPPIPHGSLIEKAIVGKLVTDLLAAGYSLSVWNGGCEAEIDKSKHAEAIFCALAASDEDEIIVNEGDTDGYAGWIRLIWGNDDCIISDYSTRLEAIISPVETFAEELAQ